MIDTNQIVKVTWSSTNRKFLEENGYEHEWRKEIEIPYCHLWDTSHANIVVVCDYCHKSFTRKYRDHIRISQKNLINKDCCSNCRRLKQEEMKEYKQENNLFEKGNNGYWGSKEVRLRELKQYIEKHQTLKNLYSDKDDGFYIWLAFQRYKHSIPEALKELNLDPDDLEYKENVVFTYKYYPKKYFNNFENLKEVIQSFINKYNKFPTIDELRFECKIGDKIIKNFGGIVNIRKLMEYSNSSELIDDNNYKNKSSYEYIVAQFLIHNNTSYLREQHPFPSCEKEYRSDFMFVVDGKVYHCEIWGNISESLNGYETNKKNKIALYKKYKRNLISIESDIFKDSYQNIQQKLKEIFEPVLGKTMHFVPQSCLITTDYTDDELFDKIMSYSQDKNYLPVVSVLKQNGVYTLYDEVVKRYGSYNKFAENYGLDIRRKEPGYWTEETLINKCIELLEKGISLDQKVLKDNGYLSIFAQIRKSNLNHIDFRLKTLSQYKGIVPEKEIILLNNIINNKGTNVKGRVTPEQQQLAKQLLDQILESNN
jgi:hypothetical protein